MSRDIEAAKGTPRCANCNDIIFSISKCDVEEVVKELGLAPHIHTAVVERVIVQIMRDKVDFDWYATIDTMADLAHWDIEQEYTE